MARLHPNLPFLSLLQATQPPFQPPSNYSHKNDCSPCCHLCPSRRFQGPCCESDPPSFIRPSALPRVPAYYCWHMCLVCTTGLGNIIDPSPNERIRLWLHPPCCLLPRPHHLSHPLTLTIQTTYEMTHLTFYSAAVHVCPTLRSRRQVRGCYRLFHLFPVSSFIGGNLVSSPFWNPGAVLLT